MLAFFLKFRISGSPVRDGIDARVEDRHGRRTCGWGWVVLENLIISSWSMIKLSKSDISWAFLKSLWIRLDEYIFPTERFEHLEKNSISVENLQKDKL